MFMNTIDLRTIFTAATILCTAVFLPISGASAQKTPEDVKQLEQRVSEGDAEAMKKLGEFLLKTGKKRAERDKGVKLLEQAIAAGRQDAMASLGTLYLWGNGVDADPV